MTQDTPDTRPDLPFPQRRGDEIHHAQFEQIKDIIRLGCIGHHYRRHGIQGLLHFLEEGFELVILRPGTNPHN